MQQIFRFLGRLIFFCLLIRLCVDKFQNPHSYSLESIGSKTKSAAIALTYILGSFQVIIGILLFLNVYLGKKLLSAYALLFVSNQLYMLHNERVLSFKSVEVYQLILIAGCAICLLDNSYVRIRPKPT